MKLTSILPEKKAAILKRWFDAVVDAYPAETAKLLRSRRNRFSNPVRHTIMEGLEGALDGLMSGGSREEISPYLDNLMRVRAVQDFSPSRAVAFVFTLKEVVREELGEETVQECPGDLAAFEREVDGLALLCFDLFVKCREKIYELKADELQRRAFRLMQRVNEIYEDPGTERHQEEGEAMNSGNTHDGGVTP